MLLSKTVKVKWTGATRKYYESKGYKFTKWRDEFEVKVKDLKECSTERVGVQCDRCLKKYKIMWRSYIRGTHEDGKHYCVNCSQKVIMNDFKKWLNKN